jgi:hypothetical protein
MGTTLIKIAECDGGIEVVERELYDRIYDEVEETLKNKGSASVRALKEQVHQTEKSRVRSAILLTVIETPPGGGVRLRSADEVDYYKKRAA